MEEVDPRWLAVEAGGRYTAATAIERYPHLHKKSFQNVDFEMTRRPKHCMGPRSVKTYLATDVDALVARLAAAEPEPVDPRWLEVEAGRRYSAKTAMERYRHLCHRALKDLPFGIARRPKTGKLRCACDVKTYAAADIDALAAERAKKRPRHAPQEPEPEPEPEADECPICQCPLDATKTLVCGHAFHRACIDDWATFETTCPICRGALEFPDD